MALSDNIKKLREKKNLTQQQLADRLYVARQTVCRWENASRCPDLITAKKLAMEFDVSLDDLISDEDIKDAKGNLHFRQSKKFRNRKKLQQCQKEILNFIEIIGAVYLVISVFLRTQLDVMPPVWCTVLGICIVSIALVINVVISKRWKI